MEADVGATARRKGGKVTKSSSAMDADKNEEGGGVAAGARFGKGVDARFLRDLRVQRDPQSGQYYYFDQWSPARARVME